MRYPLKLDFYETTSVVSFFQQKTTAYETFLCFTDNASDISGSSFLILQLAAALLNIL